MEVAHPIPSWSALSSPHLESSMAGAIQRPSLHERLRAGALRILQPRFQFLLLPPELRLQIYDYILADAIDKKSPQPLALLRVSKQVFREFRDTALEHVRPSFKRACDVHTYWRSMDPKLRCRVKHIKIARTPGKALFEIRSVLGLPWFRLKTLTIGIQANRSHTIQPLLDELCFQLRFEDTVDIVRIVPDDAWRTNSFSSWAYCSTDDHVIQVISEMAKRTWVRPQKDTLQCCKWMRGFEVRMRDGRQTLAYTLTRRAALKEIIKENGPATRLSILQFKSFVLPSLEAPGWWLLWDPSPDQIEFDVRVYE
ncbi:hypothetical protein BDV96DRAFT_321293 [Lophiotrema nucula]|uniref:F-box domain-containing protein n=1 Tax=Lophiotrema nucula TaxID=690887 RepID=A0A6A5ZLH7_9PLEO|nr:hypothetical protein BDV96DRAFT_321293 [Lophiotrema nucula]